MVTQTISLNVQKWRKIILYCKVFDEDDYRNVRFINAKRYVNENWGIKLIDEIPPKECTERVVFCDGGDGPLGHPKVYINLVNIKENLHVRTYVNMHLDFFSSSLFLTYICTYTYVCTECMYVHICSTDWGVYRQCFWLATNQAE